MSNGAPCPENDFLWEHVRHLLWSHEHFIGQPLIMSDYSYGAEIAQHIFEAPFALVSHGTQTDPIFNYANQTAMGLFEMPWAKFTTLPSKCSAEPVSREERAKLLERVTRDNYIDDYSGVRISKSGKRFRIEQATVWNVIDKDTRGYLGQAAAFSRYTFIS